MFYNQGAHRVPAERRPMSVPSASQCSTSFHWFTLEKLHNHSALSSPLPCVSPSPSLSPCYFLSFLTPFSVLYSDSLSLTSFLPLSLLSPPSPNMVMESGRRKEKSVEFIFLHQSCGFKPIAKLFGKRNLQGFSTYQRHISDWAGDILFI